ncbi:unnamed protein product [Paramecium sonneborni]|uniref:Uncharacterized protein n=1 Tax=Paramecium sonneborni TaxID=65129 RepID=A0A8S1K8X4_9CILI|nr:unnamed protein product [Paramecium sonneborni]
MNEFRNCQEQYSNSNIDKGIVIQQSILFDSMKFNKKNQFKIFNKLIHKLKTLQFIEKHPIE